MPIPVTCESCSSTFKVKDEYAGKRAKCPKCSEPLTIPTAGPPLVSAPVATARPVVASKPKPVVVDEASTESKSVNSSRVVAAKEDDRPRRRKGAEDERRPRDEADDSGQPGSKRRRRDDDDRSKKKKGVSLILILGVVGGVVLLGGGGVIAAVLLSPPPDITPRIVPEDSGVVGIPPRTAVVLSTDELVNNLSTHLGKTVTVSGEVRGVGKEGSGNILLRGGFIQTQILCNFGDVGGVVPVSVRDQVELRGQVDPVSSEGLVRLQNCVVVRKTPAAALPQGGSNPPQRTINSAESLEKNANKIIRLTAKVKAVEDDSDPVTIWLHGPEKIIIMCSPSSPGWGPLPSVGDTVMIRGQLSVYAMTDGTKSYSLYQCQIVREK